MDAHQGASLETHILAAQGGVEHAYIHIPFCRSRCHYCDFYLELAKYGGIPEFLNALHREIIGVAETKPQTLRPLKTLYIGGGTPSLLTVEAITALMHTLHDHMGFAPNAEITLEFNPEDVTPEKARGFLKAGINRFSMGVQSLNDDELKAVARGHCAGLALEAITTLHHAFEALNAAPNISVDLMYGLPRQTLASFNETLNRLLDEPIQHVSLYGLQLEAGTALETLNARRPELYPLPDDAAHLVMLALAITQLAEAGLERYEISNFARPGFESRHNTAYWQQRNYWGFGPAAHGFVYPHRTANHADLRAYIHHHTREEICATEPVSPAEHLENLLIFGLRRVNAGVNMATFQALASGAPRGEALLATVERLVREGALIQRGPIVTVAPAHLPTLHNILVELIE